MKRRTFLRTSMGFAAVSVGPGTWTIGSPASKKRNFVMRSYRPGKTVGKVLCVTPDDGFYLHTFYDVCPFSPSGRYLAVTRFPFQDRQPNPGDTADVCVVDIGPNIGVKNYAFGHEPLPAIRGRRRARVL